MATKVSLEGNILKVDDGVKILYHNAAWCDMDFTSDRVIIRNWGIPDYLEQRAYSEILFTDFQDGDAVAISTEATIATYLSALIG